MIRQGDIYWVETEPPTASEPGYTRPYVVIQNNVFNQSAINTVVVCAITSNVRRADAPGNVLLTAGEGGLPKRSVVNVSQILTLDKQLLGEHVGSLGGVRIHDILDGMRLVLDPREPPVDGPGRR